MTVVPLLAILLAAAAAAPPAPSKLAETVTVRLLVVDVLVLDRDDRTVPGLAATDFKLRVDGKTVAIDTFDAECSAAGAEPRASAADGPVTIAPSESGAPRRVALLFDETNLHDRRKWSDGLPRGAAYAEARRLLVSALPGDVEIAVAAIGDGVRFEQEFTSDRSAALAALGKLESDLTLATRWWGRSPETARRWLVDLESVVRRLEAVPGPKSVVLFSVYQATEPTDLQMRALAAAAGAARVSFYPVDAAGLVTGTARTRLSVLSRLAVDTGGRETVHTNDLTLGVARAARDLSCRYALGTYVRGTGKTSGSITVDVSAKGTRALHPAGYRLGTAPPGREPNAP